MAIRDLAAQIAAGFAPNAESSDEVLDLLNQAYHSLSHMGGEEEGTAALAAETGAGSGQMEPVMPPNKAVGQEQITCLVCGKAFKTLKRHLSQKHDMSPADYRQAFDLSKDYPLVAPGYSQYRANKAKELGLGERMAEARKQKQS
jgi:predicted transcriptional regulator